MFVRVVLRDCTTKQQPTASRDFKINDMQKLYFTS